MYKTKHVVVLFLIFILVGISAVFLTHQNKIEQTVNNTDMVSAQDYISEVRPWLMDVFEKRSITSLVQTRNELLNLRSSDKSIGNAHIALFLAFDAWEKYIMTSDSSMKDASYNHFDVASNLLPELAEDINNLKSILDDINV